MIALPVSTPRPACVLIVDDEPDNRALLEVILASLGIVVLSASTAEEALAIAADRAVDLDLILMDVRLPGMDGLAATVILKDDVATRAIPVIALTGLTMTADLQRIRAAGCDGHIAKPIRYKEFLAEIAMRLART
jgi:two-component system cell cycle response regulator DivK